MALLPNDDHHATDRFDQVRHAVVHVFSHPVVGMLLQHQLDDTGVPVDSRVAVAVRRGHEVVAVPDINARCAYAGIFADQAEVSADTVEVLAEELRDGALEQLERRQGRPVARRAAA